MADARAQEDRPSPGEGDEFDPSSGDTTPVIADDPTSQELEAAGRPAVAKLPSANIVPGSLIAGRFRIVAALGQGGMGEIYRADDLRLDQPVALKFLAPGRATDPARIQRLVQEVRLARQVAHPNVCRVYDFVDTGSEQFVAMEYVDGESLAALLRRIGRLPEPKALDLAHQISHALAAVHERGILHRDLKPENVMIDGRGQARLVDFGIASLSDRPRTDDEHGRLVGTVAYMAPEQLLGGPPSSRSDVYALGVLLFQLFTGRHPFKASNREELVRLQLHAPPIAPSKLVPDLDPAIAQLILWCLEKDPAARPASGRAVAVALPGGDALAMALAAGETPDREVVAAAEGLGPVRRPVMCAAFVAALALIAVFVALMPRTSLVARLTGILPPDELVRRARAILQDHGWVVEEGVTAQGYGIDWSYFHLVARRDRSATRWQDLSSGRSPLTFYWKHVGEVEASPGGLARSATLVFDHTGLLVELEVVPPLGSLSNVRQASKWQPFFVLAGLDLDQLRPAKPQLAAPAGSEHHLAWEGPHPGRPGRSVHVEASTFHGGVAFFKVLDSASVPTAAAGSVGQRIKFGYAFNAGVVLLALVPAVWLALHNRRMRRGDSQGALRLALGFLGTGIVVDLLRAVPLVSFRKQTISAPGLGSALILAALAWVLYLATEPYVRRRWPRTLISWSRLLGGAWRDPLVGRDTLFGVLVAALVCVLLALIRLPLFGRVMPPLAPFLPSDRALTSAAGLVASVLEYAMESIAFGLGVLVGIVVLQTITRSEKLAVALTLVAIVMPHAIYGFHHPVPFLLVHIPIFYLPTRLLRRTGLLALIVFYFAFSLFTNLVGSCDWTTWAGRQGLAALGLILILACWGFARALAATPWHVRRQTVS